MSTRRLPVTPFVRTARTGTAAGRVWANVHQRFTEGRALQEPRQWRAFWRTLGLGIAGVFVLMVVLVVIARSIIDAGITERETALLLWLGEDGPLPFYSAVFFQTISTDITLYLLIALTAGIAAWARRPITCISILAAFAISDLVGRFGWQIWARQRPDVLYEGLASPSFHSFPSGHTIKAVAIYGVLIAVWVRASNNLLERMLAGLLFLFIVVIVPLGRLTMGVHWPSDIIAGWIIGAAWLAVLVAGLRYETPPHSAAAETLSAG